MSKIAIDLDSTIWNCYPLYNEAAIKVFGRGYKEEDCTDWYWLEEEFGEDYWLIFDEALSQKNIKNRVLYDGVVEAINKLKYLKNDVYFVTHNRKPDSLREPLKNWLEESFDDIPLSMTSIGDKNPILNKIGADILIDDSPIHLENAKDIVPILVAKTHPYNRDYIKDNKNVIPFDSWDDIPDIVFKEFFSKVLI